MSATLDALELSRALIRCESITPNDGGALEVLEAELEKIGFDCHPLTFSEDGTADIQNLYARIGGGAPHFCFAGHTDTVPVGDLENWSADPFAAEVKDGVLYGRGAADMKAGIACFAAAASRFLDGRGGAFDGSISFLITGDEEGPAINGTKKLLQWADDRGEKFDACMVGEPTNPNAMGEMIKIGRRGSLNARLEVIGTGGHTAYPHLADNPVHRLVEMLAALTGDKLDDGTDHFQASTLQVSTVDVGNPATNVIPGKASARFNVRFNDLHSAADIEKWVRERLDAIGGNYELEIYISGEAFLTPPGHLSRIISGAVERITGRQPELSTSGGTSDARFIKDYCPVAEFGLVGQTMHKADESIALADIETLTDIYHAVLEDFFPQKG
ncbi:MAG: succinyl-diaminopimelate desuccinylase [Rhodospirillales bacterium]|nr:succinyl-diaminopimelate desuccinylase [Rhodospirillales bacterium]